MSEADLVAAFAEALRRQLAAESDPAKRLMIAGAARKQMHLVLDITNAERGEAEQAAVRATLTSSFDAAYYSVLADETQRHREINAA